MPGLRVKILARHPDLGIQAGGMKFAFFFAVVCFAAINTGNNLIYLVLAALCGAVIVSWILAWFSMRGLSVQLRLPDDAYAGEETRTDLLVRKRRSLLAGHSLTFKLRSEPRLEDAHQPYISRIERGENAKLHGLYTFARRGRYRVSGVHAVCNFPFGLISLGKLFKRSDELFIYPKILPLEEMFEHRAEGLLVRDSTHRGRGGGLLNIRPFVPGDDFRSLHWKASAKLGEMMLKEFAQEEGQAIWLYFNPMRSAEASPEDDDLFELAVSTAASVAFYGRKMGLKMFFSAPNLRLVPSRSGEHYHQFMRYLAEVEIEGRILSRERPSISRRRGDETLLVIDPLNTGLGWDLLAEVLDRRYFAARLEAGR